MRLLSTLYWRRHDGKLPRFKRVILETTGLANPDNPSAEMVLVEEGRPQGTAIADADVFNPHSKKLDGQQWLQAERYRRVEVRPRPGFSNRLPSTREANRHGADIEAFCLTFDQPLDWDSLIAALDVIAALRGENLLRVKGIVDLIGSDKPLVIHGVQSTLYPTSTLARWPEGPRRSRLVFIVRSTEVDFITHTFPVAQIFLSSRRSAAITRSTPSSPWSTNEANATRRKTNLNPHRPREGGDP